MGRHVNYADEQDRWIHKAEKLNRSKKKKELTLEERDPATLTLAEQLELERRRVEKKQEQKKNDHDSKKQPFISHYKPKKQ